MSSLQLFSTNSLGNYLTLQPLTGSFSSNYILSFPLATDTAVYENLAQNMSNKTFTSSTITDASNTVTAKRFATSSGTGFDVVVNGTTPPGANRVLVTTSPTAASWTTIPNGALSNSSITINTGTGLSGGGSVSLGGSLNLTNTGVTGIAYGANTRTGTITFLQGTNVTITDSPAGTFTFSVPPGAGGVSSITGTASQINASSPTGAVTLSLANTGVAAGSYTNMNATLDAQGRITSASNGAAAGTGYIGDTNTASPVGGTVHTYTAIPGKKYSLVFQVFSARVSGSVTGDYSFTVGNATTTWNGGSTTQMCRQTRSITGSELVIFSGTAIVTSTSTSMTITLADNSSGSKTISNYGTIINQLN